jgi:hypothetical protein
MKSGVLEGVRTPMLASDKILFNYIRDLDIVSIYDFFNGFWNCSGGLIFF